MTSIVLNLPLPPSTNHLFENVRGYGRVKSKAYKQWIQEAGWELAVQRAEHIAGWYELSIFLPASVRGDIDNRAKALSDLLVKHAVIPDDKKAWALHIHRDHRVESGCQAVVRPVSDAERGISE